VGHSIAAEPWTACWKPRSAGRFRKLTRGETRFFVCLSVCLRVFVCLALCMSALFVCLRSLFDRREALDRLVFFLVFKSEVLYR
jgi:hypothetical protein